MEKERLLKGIKLVILGSVISLSTMSTFAASSRAMQLEESAGIKYFEGSSSFLNGGPACISCHNVKNDQLMTGGLLAKDLTDVYTRLGEGIAVWLSAPPFPAMAASYQNHPLTENERGKLSAFLKYANEVKGSQTAKTGYSTMLIGGLSGLAGLLIIINFMYMNRKKKMVKKDIFDRQHSAWDAKH